MNDDKLKQDDIFGTNPSSQESGVLKPNEKKLLFSYSKMSMYQECPLKYKFKYEDKLPEKPKSYFALGKAIHKALEHFYSQIPIPSLEVLNAEFEKQWKQKNYLEKGYASPDKEASDLKKALGILERYHLKHRDEKKLPFLLEYSTDVEVDGLKVRIIADKIEYLGGGRIRIVDYKTGKEGKRNSDQLYLYQKISEADFALAKKAEDKFGEKLDSVRVEDMIYYYVETLKEKIFPRAGDLEIGEFWERALKVSEDIVSKRFEANPGEFQCAFCDYREKYCPVYAESFAVERKKKSVVKKIKTGGVIEEYAETFRILKELKEKLRVTEIELLKELGDEPVYFENEKISLKLSKKEKVEFKDREKILEILKSRGLYEKVSRPTVQAINELLSDPSVDEEAKKEIRKNSSKTFFINPEISGK